MKTYYKTDLKQTYLILEGEEGEKEDYQISMLKGNEVPGILKTDVRYKDNQSHYYYDITGKTSFQVLHERMPLSYEDMKGLVSGLLHTIKTLQKYMLESNYLLLEPEYIFCDKDGFYFCYCPICEKDAKKEFHKLTEFFVREVHYQDEKGVQFAYHMHKATMEDNYSIEQIMEELIPEEKQGEELLEEEEEIVDYARQIEPQELEDILVEEKIDFWEPVKRLLEKKGITKGCKTNKIFL